MRKNSVKILLTLTTLAVLLAACGGGTGEEPAVSDADAVLTQAAEIAIRGLTQTAEAMPPTSTPLPIPTETPTLMPVVNPTTIPTNASLVSPTVDPNATQAATSDATAAADASPTALPTISLTSPTSAVSIPPTPTRPPLTGGNTDFDSCYSASFTTEGPPYDFTQIYGGKTFTKTWRIRNNGTCPWDSNVYLRWITTSVIVNGVEVKEVAELFGQTSAIPVIIETINPNDHLDISVEFTVPVLETGSEIYKVYFMLGTPDGIFYVDGGALWFIVEALPP